MKTRQLLAAALATGFVATSASAALIEDNFDVDSSANYTQVDDSNSASNPVTTFDGTVTHAYDYSADGIASAPNSTGGTTIGVRMTVNDSALNGGVGLDESHVSLFHNTSVSGSYVLSVDMYMGIERDGTGAFATGSTEMASVGVGSTGADYNAIFTPISGQGRFISITGDGGSSSDYRHYVAPGNPVASGDSTYLNDLNTTDRAGDLYQDLFPATDFVGSPGNSWTTLTITVDGGLITYALDGVDIIQDTVVVAANETDGLVSIGYMDPFDSIGPHFVIFDNLTVTQIPEPGSLALLGLGGLAMLRRRR